MCSRVDPSFSVQGLGARLHSGVAGHVEVHAALLGVGGVVHALVADGVDGGQVLGLGAGRPAGAGRGGGEADDADRVPVVTAAATTAVLVHVRRRCAASGCRGR